MRLCWITGWITLIPGAAPGRGAHWSL